MCFINDYICVTDRSATNITNCFCLNIIPFKEKCSVIKFGLFRISKIIFSLLEVRNFTSCFVLLCVKSCYVIHNTSQIWRNFIDFCSRKKSDFFSSFSWTSGNKNLVRILIFFLYQFKSNCKRHKCFCSSSRSFKNYQRCLFKVCHKSFNHKFLTIIFRYHTIRMVIFILQFYNFSSFDSSKSPIPIKSLKLNKHIFIHFTEFFFCNYFSNCNFSILSELFYFFIRNF